MIPPAFDYHAPASLPEAIALLSRYRDSAKVLSGGQSLLPLLKLRLGAADHVVDIGRIPGLEYIRKTAATCASAAARASRPSSGPT
jgi:carbon-monoxide dehydrogenase medium subunit